MSAGAHRKQAKNSAFLDACRRFPTSYTPVWLMRQAGRYLPQYRKVRRRHSFIEMCKTPELAAEVTLQPVDYLGVDAAILFADIMLPLEGMGVEFEFAEGEGPVISGPIKSEKDIRKLRVPQGGESAPYVMETIKVVRERLAGRAPLIGFSGAPFTLASYLIEGGHSRNFVATKRMMYNEPEAFRKLMSKLSDMVSNYLGAQVKAGAQALQVFDSWVGIISPLDYDKFVMPYSRRIFKKLKHLAVPIIHFGADTATLLERMREAGGDVISVDWRIPINEAWRRIGYDRAIQGNLDPTVLFAPVKIIKERVRDILKRAASRPGHIFNLGHGVLPKTPPDSVKAMVDMVHEISARGAE